MSKLCQTIDCTGCTACASVCPFDCIAMTTDENGFICPVVDTEKCVECGICESVCPVLNKSIKAKGDLPSAYAAFTGDERTRQDSSSGGVFTEIAKRIIAQSGVVYGAAYDDEFRVQHICVDNEDDLAKLRGAKYAESNLGSSFVELLDRLKQGQIVLFSGTPCQVAGLKSFVKEDFDNLICVDFVCHGVPSPMAWKSYIEYRIKEDAAGEWPCNINLRSKDTGWSKYNYSNVFEYKNGKQYSELSSQSLFMKLFVGDYISRLSCSNCSFKGYSRVSDITLGDFWGIWDIDPEMDDNKGTSVVLVHSNNGQTIWQDISSKIKYREVTLEQASQQNPSMLHPSKEHPDRERVLEQIRNGHIAECRELFIESKLSFISRVKRKVKQILR